RVRDGGADRPGDAGVVSGAMPQPPAPTRTGDAQRRHAAARERAVLPTHQMPRVEAGGGPRHGPAMGLGFTLVRSVALPILTVFAVPILAKEISPKGDRAVTVRADPDSHSRPVGTLNPGDHATVRGAERQWWEVSLSDGTDGFVSKRSTEVVPDSGSSGGRGGDGSAGASPTGEGWNAFAGYPTCRRPDCQ